MRRHLFIFLRVLEGNAAVGTVHAFQAEVATTLTRRLAIAFYLSSLAFVASTSKGQ
jgi:hypothetical protein